MGGFVGWVGGFFRTKDVNTGPAVVAVVIPLACSQHTHHVSTPNIDTNHVFLVFDGFTGKKTCRSTLFSSFPSISPLCFFLNISLFLANNIFLVCCHCMAA